MNRNKVIAITAISGLVMESTVCSGQQIGGGSGGDAGGKVTLDGGARVGRH